MTKRASHAKGRARPVGLHVRISARAIAGVREMAAKRRLPIHAVVEAAIDCYLSPAAQDQRDAMIGRHLNRLSRGVESVDFNSKLVVAMLRYMVELDLSYLPEPETDEDRRQISAKGTRRFDRFEQWLTRQLADPDNLYERVHAEFKMPESPD